MTIRYILALSLIACVLLAAFFTVNKQISLNEKDAYLVNISGQQRMLSQRIALMAREVYHAPSKAMADELHQKMQSVTKRMMDNHIKLVSGDLGDEGSYELSDTIRSKYYGYMSLDTRVRKYVLMAKQFIELYDTGGLEAVRDSTMMPDIVAIARNGLLGDLNEVVGIYEAEAQAKIQRFRTIEMFILSFGLLTLMIEVLFIFRPMVRGITDNVGELDRANTELLEYSYRISHDLLAPVKSSIGLVNVAEKGLDQDKKHVVKASLGHIQKSMTRLQSLVEDITNLNKMKMNDIQPEAVHLGKMIDELIIAASELRGAASIDVQKDIRVKELITVKRVYIQQCLDNLFSNAVKYFDMHEGLPFIRVEAGIDGDECVIGIIDNGIGIPEEYRDQVFGMFKRFHPKVSFGNGLGLYLVKQNIQSIGGSVEYTPLDSGSKFTLRFPVTIKAS